MGKSNDIRLAEDFWDCECKENYIHGRNRTTCSKCGACEVSQPDSRQEEIDRRTAEGEKVYEVEVIESNSKAVKIIASTAGRAEAIVENAYSNGDITLAGYIETKDVNFNVI